MPKFTFGISTVRAKLNCLSIICPFGQVKFSSDKCIMVIYVFLSRYKILLLLQPWKVSWLRKKKNLNRPILKISKNSGPMLLEEAKFFCAHKTNNTLYNWTPLAEFLYFNLVYF